MYYMDLRDAVEGAGLDVRCWDGRCETTKADPPVALPPSGNAPVRTTANPFVDETAIQEASKISNHFISVSN